MSLCVLVGASSKRCKIGGTTSANPLLIRSYKSHRRKLATSPGALGSGRTLTGVSGVYGELSDRSVRMKALGELPLSCLNAALKALSDR